MFRKILIANRGEIAVRIIRACKEMGIETVVIYSEPDSDALHAQLADEAVCVGPAKAQDSYLNIKNILSAAMITGCDAVHPGFGFLSENASFADLVKKCGLVFIGPDGDVIRAMGNKSEARRRMVACGVPVVPGSVGGVDSLEQGLAEAEKIGYPVLIKASSGGGGRGMRRVFSPEEFECAFSTAKAEAKACFGDDEVYVEKLIQQPRHIEFQIFADSKGNVIHLGERECSIQRRNQKMIEESPSRALTPALREKMGEHAVMAARAAEYRNAGTVEFVLDKQGNYYFIEMNTRVQVEHPVTEMVTGVDIIREQIRVAAGFPLSMNQEDVKLRGASIECRINAENPYEGFRPCPGQIVGLHLPGGPGVRVDTALYPGCKISPHYDNMIAKLIVHGPTRADAIRKMRRSLEEFLIQGVETNIELQYLILHHQDFIKGRYDTGFMEKHLDTLVSY
ncbi:MAG: acetyl-CoA carboxylase biotin carboxylase subunit [Oscillospiraceae bacterium]|nr:acetyl-CoA carboxylase biotin carboxylase subunit [Oscillospiraceae bacterium]